MSREPTDDTDPRIAALQLEAYRRMTPTQKLQIVCDLMQATRELAVLDVRRRHPEASEYEVKLRVASRWLTPEQMVAAFGWDPRVEGY